MDPSTAIVASRLSNEGVSLIENGLYDEAIAAFSKGLVLVKQVLALQGDDTLDEAATDGMVNSAEPVSQSPLCHFHEMQEREEVPSDDPFTFRAPIFIPSHATDRTSFAYFLKTSFILLYNIALTHHLSALSGDDTLKRLRKALSLYELAYTIQMTADIQLTALQTMAIVNNLGQIHTLLEDEEKSWQCFSHLLSSILFLIDCGDRHSVEQMDGFIANVMYLILKGSAPAAAA
jgi:tetratricopeptide (TPR) repeat protein